jgi:hypothetical protein
MLVFDLEKLVNLKNNFLINFLSTAPPLAPEIDLNNQGFFESNTRMNVSCTSRDGRPAAQINWFLGDRELEKNSQDTVYDTMDRNNQTLYTVNSHLIRFVQPDDDGKELICRATHSALPAPGYLDTKTIVQVRYSPMALPEQRITGLVLGGTAQITVPVRANPRPRIQWKIDGRMYEEGTQDSRYIINAPRSIVSSLFLNVANTI